MMNIKQDFPIFTSHSDLVYLDSASTTHKPNFVIEQTNKYISSSYANIGRGSYPLAMQSEDVYDASKAAAAKLINTTADQIIYTHSSTYAYNMLAYSLVESGILTS
jgi:cysteine desulfurase / selenocysteine lyase